MKGGQGPTNSCKEVLVFGMLMHPKCIPVAGGGGVHANTTAPHCGQSGWYTVAIVGGPAGNGFPKQL